jgi:hypothetical protein
MMMIGVYAYCSSSRSILHNLKPSISGIIRSSKNRSGCTRPAVWMAVVLSFTEIGSYPAHLRILSNILVVSMSSSTIMIFVICFFCRSLFLVSLLYRFEIEDNVTRFEAESLRQLPQIADLQNLRFADSRSVSLFSCPHQIISLLLTSPANPRYARQGGHFQIHL